MSLLGTEEFAGLFVDWSDKQDINIKTAIKGLLLCLSFVGFILSPFMMIANGYIGRKLYGTLFAILFLLSSIIMIYILVWDNTKTKKNNALRAKTDTGDDKK